MENTNTERLHTLLQELQQSLQSLTPAEMNANNQAVFQTFPALQQAIGPLTVEVNQMQSNGNLTSEQVDQARQNITTIRTAIQTITGQIEQAEGAVVTNYRSALGPHKEQFESVSDSEQQTMNAGAYYSVQAYREYENIIQLLHEINAELMDMSQSLEHQLLDEQPDPPVILDQNFESDPAPSRLSP
ncbi:hypothetical protein [Aneurinibacillus terranovensis]|uniref:hypothetical protein n=1 Tax=Aneurinibacillus terranovensis TaxID=278991 RepID=UPI00041D990E|nr:hypothetical protein [Aneurinibacillus terranovensis]